MNVLKDKGSESSSRNGEIWEVTTALSLSHWRWTTATPTIWAPLELFYPKPCISTYLQDKRLRFTPKVFIDFDGATQVDFFKIFLTNLGEKRSLLSFLFSLISYFGWTDISDSLSWSRKDLIYDAYSEVCTKLVEK